MSLGTAFVRAASVHIRRIRLNAIERTHANGYKKQSRQHRTNQDSTTQQQMDEVSILDIKPALHANLSACLGPKTGRE